MKTESQIKSTKLEPYAGSSARNAEARCRLMSRVAEPMFIADWDRLVFIHYEVDSELLQAHVPFPLDLRDGKAYVSLVAFTMRNMRLRWLGRLGAWLCRPIATHEFLNVRTYVRHGNEPGIYFIAEYLPNSLCVRFGPAIYGLPYRRAQIEYNHRHETGELSGCVRPGAREEIRYSARMIGETFVPCRELTLDEFLLERYTAYTCCAGTRRYFRIWHPPWSQASVDVVDIDDGWLRKTFSWFSDGRRVGANYSPGERDVWMGCPHRVRHQSVRKKRGTLTTFFEMP